MGLDQTREKDIPHGRSLQREKLMHSIVTSNNKRQLGFFEIYFKFAIFFLKKKELKKKKKEEEEEKNLPKMPW